MPQAEPHRPSFVQLVRAESPPSRLEWHLRDTLTVASIPLILLLGFVYSALGMSAGETAVTDTALRMAIFVGLVVVNAPLLARHWRHFRAASGRSWLLVIVGVVVIQLVVSLVESVLRGPVGASGGDGQPASQLAFGVVFFASFGPTVTALIEDFVFRHTLLLKIPAWRHVSTAAALVLVNAVVFGAIHINNFGGDWLLTLSYAAAGLLMNLVYLWTRNIWHVLLMHGLNNFLLAGPLVVLFVHLVTGE